MWRASLLTACLLLIPSAAAAQDFDLEDDIDFEDAEDPAPADDLPDEELPELDGPVEGGVDVPVPPDDGAFDLLEEEDDALEDFTDPVEGEGEPIDLLEGEATPAPSSSGDSAALYRMRQEEYARLGTDEEIAAWEAYLAEFPHTPFAERIQQRVDELMDSLYDTRIRIDQGTVDAMDQEIGFSQGAMLESIDPRTRLRAGFEMGLPDWFNPFVDYEHAFAREFSAHIGLRRRSTGTSIEPGVRWALVKSARTQTLVTLVGDFRLNAAPSAFFGARPMLAVGKRFGDSLDVQLQAGVDLLMRNGLVVATVGGLSATYRVTDTVGLFLEGSANMRDVGGQSGPGYFNAATFGMRFFPSKDKSHKARPGAELPVSDDVQVDIGATVPAMTNYFTDHYGSIFGQATLYLD